MISSLPERPLIRRHVLRATIEEEDVFLLSEDHAWLWKNRRLARLLPYLDGSRTLSELFEIGGTEMSAPEIIYLLKQLQNEQLLAEGTDVPATDGSGGEVAFWHAMDVEYSAARRIRESRVRLRFAGSFDRDRALEGALRALGVVVEDARAVLNVVVTDHYFRPALAQANQDALETGLPWMPLKLSGEMHWIGPVFVPGRTGCLACLQDRLRLNRQVEDFVVRKTGDPGHYETSLATSPAAARLSSMWAAQEIALWLAGRSDRMEGRLLALSCGATATQVSSHELIRRPQCPVCGDPVRARGSTPITLTSTPIVSGSGHRVETPEKTLERLSRHISPITGVVKWLSDLGQDVDGLVHCYAAGHSFSLGPDTTYWLRQSLRSRTGGKGTTAVQAKVSAICEAIERYCGVFRDDVPRIRATYQKLGDTAVHPYRCLNFSASQYDRREELNANDREGFFHLIPNRFHDDLDIDWVPLWSLTSGKVVHLPAAFCYYGHPDVERHFFCTGDANGCAAGNVIEEAVLHAFLELVERDSAAIWWYNQLSRPAIDLDSISDPYICRVRDYYQHHGRDLWALDLTSDLGIPVVAAVSRRTDGSASDLLIGLGASLDAATAVVKAVVEVNQFLPAVSRRAPNGETLYSWPDDVAVRFWKTETLASQPQLTPDPSQARQTLSHMAGLGSADLYNNVQTCIDTARRFGLEVLVLDQSRPDIDLAVVRVVVPGLRHFWRRLGPGRLYDVPVQLGWLSAQAREENLNPVSIFF
jgi:bacteriocin biosynthesis cyclodehydratase domain-containing protein